MGRGRARGRRYCPAFFPPLVTYCGNPAERGDVDMKRLFCLKFQNGQLVTKAEDGLPCYFTNKKDAKAVRDAMNAGHKVSRGPDHKGKCPPSGRNSRTFARRGTR